MAGILKKVADPLGIHGSREHKNPVKQILDPAGVFAEKRKKKKTDAYEGPVSWRDDPPPGGGKKAGGLVTRGSAKEKSRLNGSFKIR